MDRADDAQRVGVERLAQTRVESIVVDTCDVTQEAGIDPTAVHRGQPQQIASRNGKGIDAGEEKIVQRSPETPSSASRSSSTADCLPTA